MATPIFAANVLPIRTYIRWSAREVQDFTTDFNPLLDLWSERTGAESAVIYQHDPETSEYFAVASRYPETPRVQEIGLTLTESASGWLARLAAPEQGSSVTDPRFERFPESVQTGLETLLVLPLTGDGVHLGIAVLGRRKGLFPADTLALASRIAQLAAAVLERDVLTRKLRERKLIERAKGIVQQRRGLSEEHAYLLLRNTSRRRRLPMAEVAREIVENVFAKPIAQTA